MRDKPWAEQPPADTPDPAASKKLLILKDGRIDEHTLPTEFEQHGYKVSVAALEDVDESPNLNPDYVLIEPWLIWSRNRATMLVDYLRTRFPDAKIVVQSGLHEEVCGEDRLEKGLAPWHSGSIGEVGLWTEDVRNTTQASPTIRKTMLAPVDATFEMLDGFFTAGNAQERLARRQTGDVSAVTAR